VILLKLPYFWIFNEKPMNTQAIRYYVITFFVAITLAIISREVKAQNIPAQRLTNWSEAGLAEAIQEPAKLINFIDAGGKNNDAAFNDSVLNQLISLAPVTIFFPHGEYDFSQTIALPSNVIIRGESAEFTIFNFDLIQNSNLISVTGIMEADTFIAAADVFCGSSTIMLHNIAGIQKGDLFKIVDHDSALVTSSWALHSTGQLVRVDSIIGDRVVFSSKFRRNFLVSRKAYIQRIVPVENVGIENITINCEHATSTQTSNIYLNYTHNCHVKCVESFKANFAHIDVRNSAHVLIEGSYFKDAWSYGGGGKGYGVVLHHSTSDCRVSDNAFNHLRHSILLQAGANGNVVSYNYSINPYWTDVALPSNSAGDLVLHGNWPYRNLFEGNIVQNIVVDDSHGKNGPNNVFLRNRAELFGVFMNNSPATDSLIFVGNETTATGLFYGNFSLYGVGHFSYGNSQKGSLFPTGTGNPTYNSLYLMSAPSYYQNWPLIGLPVSPKTNNNRAKIFFSSGYYTLCSASLAAGSDEQKKRKKSIKIFPNPVENVLSFDGDLAQINEINIYDITGKLFLSSEPTLQINVSHLPQGIYFIKIEFVNGENEVRKFIKSH